VLHLLGMISLANAHWTLQGGAGLPYGTMIGGNRFVKKESGGETRTTTEPSNPRRTKKKAPVFAGAS
jgi:hypothetical protein